MPIFILNQILICLFFFSFVTSCVSPQTIIWTQPPKAGPARTFSDPPDCPPTLLSHTPSPSQTTTHTPAPPEVGENHLTEFSLASCTVNSIFHFPMDQMQTYCRCAVDFVSLGCHIYSPARPFTAFHSELCIQTRGSLSSLCPLSLSSTEETLLDRRRWRELESQSSKSKSFILLWLTFFNMKKKSLRNIHKYPAFFVWCLNYPPFLYLPLSPSLQSLYI